MISNAKKEEILAKIINRYGLEKQLVKLQEECGELITAISKYKLASMTVIIAKGDKL